MKGHATGFGRLTIATWVTAALLAVACLPVSSAGSRVSPEITDLEGDVSPTSFALNNPQNASLFQNVTAYDVVKSWIGLETLDDFWIFIEVKDLPDGWGLPADPPDESPFGSNATFVGTSLVANFTIASQTYRAIFKLHMPEPGAIMDNYTVWRANGEWVAVAGAYNTTQDWVAMKLPKDLFPGVADNVRLSQFWVLGRFGNLSMDFAPNARDPATGSLDPVSLAKKLAGGQSVVTPVYGYDYAFGQYYHPAGTPGYTPSAPVPHVEVTIMGEDSRMIMAGTSTSYELRVTNHATSSDTVFLSLSSAAEGWSHQLSESEMTLGAGEARVVFLTVAASQGASEPLRSLVDASSQLGGSDNVAFLTLVHAVESSSPPNEDDEDEHDDEETPAADKGGGAPGFEFLLVAAAVVGYAVYRRRN